MAVSPPSDDPTRPAEPSQELIREVLRGRAPAIDAWFRAEHAPVYRLCFGLLADATEAEDAAQDSMLHLHDHLSDWDSTRSYRAWRNTLVLNQCRDRRRRIGARRRAETAAAEAGLPNVLPDPVAELQRTETMDVLRRALARLSPREREVFVLRDLEDLATSEVARVLDIGVGTVRTLSMLARRRLRGLLADRVRGLGPEGMSGGGGRG